MIPPLDVDLDALDRHAASVGRLGEDLGTAVARWQHALADPCAPSVAAVRDAYAKDFAVYAEVLRTWADAAHTATAGYRAADSASADQL